MKPLQMTPRLAGELVAQAESMRPEEIGALQKERLQVMLNYVRANSPYLRKKYETLPDTPALADIPPMHRSDAMENFEDWVCDREITSEGLDAYLSDPDNSSALYLDRYRVLTTSGTTGMPLRMIRDDRHNIVHQALIQGRLLGGSKLGGIPELREPFYRWAGIASSGAFHSTYLSFMRMKKGYDEAGRGDDIIPLFIGLGTGEMIDRLNAFQPVMLTGYPSNMRLLAMHQKRGKLRISPKAVVCSAEHLSLGDIELIEETFGCRVMNNYCSTEGGELAMLCSENRMHINADWAIVEPVDRNLNPVAYGEESSGVLLTNLANLVSPVIRYYVSDRIVLHDAPCACGLPFPYIDIEGRKEDTLEFAGSSGEMLPVPSILFVKISMEIPGCDQVQFIQRGAADLEIRYVAAEGAPRETIGEELAKLTAAMLGKEGLGNVRLGLSAEPPILGKSGKLQNTMKIME